MEMEEKHMKLDSAKAAGKSEPAAEEQAVPQSAAVEDAENQVEEATGDEH